MAHEDATLTVELLPKSSGAEIRLDDFLEQMQSIKSALRETERFMSGGSEPSLYLRINDIRTNSPIHATLEAVPESAEGLELSPVTVSTTYASSIVRRMTTNLRVISRKRRRPVKIDVPVLESYRKMATPAEKYRVDVKITADNHSVTINRQFREILESIVGEDEYSYGSVSGMVEGINMHEYNRRFWLYPVIGASKIVGTFRTKDRKKFAATVDKYVTVYGRLVYKSWDKFPYAVQADDVTIHETQRTGLQDMRGFAPNATGVLNSKEFTDKLRDDEW